MNNKFSTAPIYSDNINHLSRMDVGGAGQVTVDGDFAYLGYMRGPEGTSILDISDPRHPKVLSTIMLDKPGLHSHKVRVVGDIMIVNSERYGAQEPFEDGGFKLYDISDKRNPKLICFQKTHGKGVHRFACDERYAYISTEMEGFVGNILVIYDIRNPSKPEEAGRWWMPGQNVAAGEMPLSEGKEHRLHHALRHKDHLYAGCWMSGYWIIDVADVSQPKTIGSCNVHPANAEPSHTFVRVPFPVAGTEIALGVDEERSNRGNDAHRPHAPLYVFDVSDPKTPRKISEFHVPDGASPYANAGPGTRYGAHQLREVIDDTYCYVTWFGAGLRIIDFSDPAAPRDVGHFIPEPGRGYKAPLTNDVSMDHRGLLYVTDKGRGLDVIEFSR